MAAPDSPFAAVEQVLLRERGTAAGSGFGASPGVTVGGKIAAMLVAGRLVVKLPAERCRTIVDAGTGEPLRMGTRTMREWVTIGPEREAEWVPLALEALAFVRPAT